MGTGLLPSLGRAVERGQPVALRPGGPRGGRAGCRALEFKHTPQIGRTNGVHAEPITIGLKLATWYSENCRNLARFREAARQMAAGKISGAFSAEALPPHGNLRHQIG